MIQSCSHVISQARLITSVSAISITVSLSGCASIQGAFADIKADFRSSKSVTMPADMQRAVYVAEDPEAKPEPAAQYSDAGMPSLIMDGQMKPRPAIEFARPPSMSGFQAVSYANRTAAVQPTSENYLNAIQLYPYTPGSLYQVYTSPSQVTDIALERGEGLTSVSAGDTERWTVGDTVSGSGAESQVHILVKPMAAQLSTNAVITTTKRTYYLDLKSFADTYMAAVSWRYPHDVIKQMIKPVLTKPVLTKAGFSMADLDVKPEKLQFVYAIKGDTPIWRPTRVFDDGRKVYIQFPENLSVSEAPPLFVTDGKGKGGNLVNYRVKGEYYIVDRLFDAAELRLGEKDQTIVRIERQS